MMSGEVRRRREDRNSPFSGSAVRRVQSILCGSKASKRSMTWSRRSFATAKARLLHKAICCPAGLFGEIEEGREVELRAGRCDSPDTSPLFRTRGLDDHGIVLRVNKGKFFARYNFNLTPKLCVGCVSSDMY